MSLITEVYEELKNNNLALESIEDMLSDAKLVNAEKLYHLLRKITDSNNVFLEKLATPEVV